MRVVHWLSTDFQRTIGDNSLILPSDGSPVWLLTGS